MLCTPLSNRSRPHFRPLSGKAPAVALAACSLGQALPAAGIVHRNDVTDQQVLDLAQQGQFAGVGSVFRSGSSGSGVALSRDWVLTAAHFTNNGQATTFRLNGVNYAGTAVHQLLPNGQPRSDVALIRLNPGVRLPSDTVFVAPLADGPVFNQQFWKLGLGRHGTRAEASGGPDGLNPGDGRVRAGTNVFTRAVQTFFGPSLVFNRNTNALETPFESTTAPGDSGGPAFLQRNNQWFIAGLTSGAIGGVGFVDADVAESIDFLRSTTGLDFAPQAGPTELFWDPDFATAGVQGGAGSWTTDLPTWGAGDFQYTWESDFAPVAVFGTPASGAALVTVDGDITARGIRFAPIPSTSGPFQILDGSGALRVGAQGFTVESQVFARLNAEVVGGGDFHKTGSAALTFDGDNRTFTGEIFVDEGTLTLTRAESLGVGGFNAGTRTTVASGATLELRGQGLASGELIRLQGEGVDGVGALAVTRGDHVLTESIALLGAARVTTSAGTSLSLSGDRGRFFNQQVVTKGGEGALVLDTLNNIAGLVVESGSLAGDGGVSGAVVVARGATLRPGDSAEGAGIGTFQTNDFTLNAGAELHIELDAVAGTIDLVDVRGAAALAGELRLSLLSAPVAGESYVFLENDGLDAVRGLLSNGATVSASLGGQTFNFLLDYAAGTGNDVALTLVQVPEPGTALALAAAGLSLLGRRSRR